jgi:16S rRNA (uracil1498-N3)-methyltransferase
MSPRGTAPGRAAARRFFLESAPVGGRAELCADDMRHATQVLRLGAGDRALGLDGAGAEWPLQVRESAGRGARALELEVTGEPRREPRPGEALAPLPWIEIAVALPRGAAAEEMLDRLTQLGAAAITPLTTDRGQRAPVTEGSRHARWLRITREACKQSGRLWLPALGEARTPAALTRRPQAALLVLDPLAAGGLSDWIDGASGAALREATENRPLVVAIGPEGGFSPEESATFAAAGAESVRVGPHVLRIETAAEASLAILSERAFRRFRS